MEHAMTIAIRPAEARGHESHGWLDSFHSFSFAHYYDSSHMGFGPLRVINEDRVEPGMGFGEHGHSDMEIISYVLDGALEHKDSIGTGSVIRPGDVQRMSAGTGIRHSEFNHSISDRVHFLQIWILPERKGIPPNYEQKTFSTEDKRGKLRLIGSRDGRDGSVTIHRDVDLYATLPGDGGTVNHALGAGRIGWVHVAQGTVNLNGEELRPGDGVALDAGAKISLTGTSDDAEVLVFDMAA
jgi:redox-sensitive bicupin YhaK (pirin superfamily)